MGMIEYRFSGHQTFVFRHGWLEKGVDLVRSDPRGFLADDAIVRLGVGKNMVESIKYGVDGLDGVDGVAELEVDGIRVEMLEDSQARSLIACAEIGLPPPDANGAFGSMMLKANFQLRATAGATLCQNPETGAYALVRPFPLALADGESLAAGLESLVNQTENWRTALAGLREAEAAQPAGQEVDDSHHDMLSSGYFHV